jgi:hypothetical protein
MGSTTMGLRSSLLSLSQSVCFLLFFIFIFFFIFDLGLLVAAVKGKARHGDDWFENRSTARCAGKHGREDDGVLCLVNCGGSSEAVGFGGGWLFGLIDGDEGVRTGNLAVEQGNWFCTG